jgi:hypothetical protein
MAFDYNSADELFALVRAINQKYYKQASANVIYLEEITDTNQVVYITQIRDAYSHLVKIFDYEDILDAENKSKIQVHLDRYSGHIERILLDTYRKIVSEKIKSLKAILNPNDIEAVKMQIAGRIKTLRVVDDSFPNEDKIKGYDSLIQFIEDAFNKFYYRKP